jgi:subtilisin family serine protease
LESVNERLDTRTTEAFPALDIKVVEFDRDRPVEEVLAAYRRDPKVEYAEPDFFRYPAAAPNDPRFAEQWGVQNTGQSVERIQGTPGADIDALPAWETSRGDSAVVALVDTGVNIDHPDLAPSIWTNPAEIPGDGQDNDGNGYVDDVNGWNFHDGNATVFNEFDGEEHGTHTAGTLAAAANNGEGVSGVAPAAGIMPLKACGAGTCTSSAIVAAFDYAARNGADVVNGSFGGVEFSQAEKDAIERGKDKGLLFVFPAGNAGEDADAAPFYPASYDNENIVSVAASDNRDELADFSNYGTASVDLAAPGVGILSTGAPSARAPVAIRVDGAYRSTYTGFGLEQISGADARKDFLSKALTDLTSAPADPLLLVDDDGGASHETRYREALSSLGYTDVTVAEVAPGSDGPDAARMQGKTVVWLTGAEYTDTLRAADRTSLSSHLDGGGRLLLMGQDIGYDIGGGSPGASPTPFYTGKLKARLMGDDFDPESVSGPPGGAFGESSYRLSGGDSAGYRGYVDRLDYAVGGSAALLSDAAPVTYAKMSGTSMAAPYVSGTAALLASHAPSAGHLEIKAAILDSAEKTLGLEGRTATGGRLEASAALARISPPAPPPSDTGITLDSSRKAILYNRRTTLTGVLSGSGESLAGRQVTLIERAIGDKKFSEIPDGTVTTNAQGEFSKQIKPSKNTYYRARFSGGTEYLRSTSGPARVNVRANVSLGVGKDNVQKGRRVGMGGIVRPAHAGDKVRLIIKRGGKRIGVQTVTLNENSRYTFLYRPPGVGRYAVRAVFLKQDRDHLGNVSRPLDRFRVTR